MDGFKVGDVVRLKSGGPKMTVSHIKDGNVWCTWFVGETDPKNAYFKPEMLALA